MTYQIQLMVYVNEVIHQYNQLDCNIRIDYRIEFLSETQAEYLESSFNSALAALYAAQYLDDK